MLYLGRVHKKRSKCAVRASKGYLSDFFSLEYEFCSIVTNIMALRIDAEDSS